MPRKRFTNEQIAFSLRQAENGATVDEVYLQHLRLAHPDRADRGKRVEGLPGPPPSPSLLALHQAIIGRLFVGLIPPVRCPNYRGRFRLPSDLEVPGQCQQELSPYAAGKG